MSGFEFGLIIGLQIMSLIVILWAIERDKRKKK